MGRGLYIHIPFCKKRCSYCDFTTFAGREDLMEDYTDALIRELEIKTEGKIYDTVFIGGGTPNYLRTEELKKLLRHISENIKKTNGYEFTMEGNPEFMTGEIADIMLGYGVNRISMGLQSSDDDTLKVIGRIHTYDRFLRAYETLRNAGFKNINLDMILGLPGTDPESFEKQFRFIEKLSPEHVSVYSLILEEGTAMERAVEKGILRLPKEEDVLRMMDISERLLTSWGYGQYEISNFSKKGYECRHNINYWNTGEYIAAGVAASGFESNIRYKNTESLEEYIMMVSEGKDPVSEIYENTREDSMEEFMFLGLRMNRGILISDFERRFGVILDDIYGDVIRRHTGEGFLVRDHGRIYFSKKGMRVSNSILCDFML